MLACAGINNNLAPVADVPSSTASFMYQEGRTFSFDATTTASLSNAFASGLVARGVFPAMKHFPGLGFARRNTDVQRGDHPCLEIGAGAGTASVPEGDRAGTCR